MSARDKEVYPVSSWTHKDSSTTTKDVVEWRGEPATKDGACELQGSPHGHKRLKVSFRSSALVIVPRLDTHIRSTSRQSKKPLIFVSAGCATLRVETELRRPKQIGTICAAGN
jgi:hypothetical protein